LAGSEVRIVHAADIHLDSPLRGLGRLDDPDLVASLRLATRHAFDNLIEYCLAQTPDALLLAGDLYDGDWRDYSTGQYFVNRMRDLADAKIPVFFVRGNHDAESVITRSLTLPPTTKGFSTDKPESHVLDDVGLAVHGQGFATRSVTSNLASAYPNPHAGLINVGLLHTSIQGYEGHDPYAPCSENDLYGRDYEYFALGHVHKQQQSVRGRSAWAFSGNLQGRNPRETGPKGALDVRLSLDAAPVITFVPLDVARWESLEVDLSDATDAEAAFSIVDVHIARVREEAGDRPVVMRLALSGETELAGALADAQLLGEEIRPRARRHGVAIDKIRSSLVTPRAATHLPEAQRTIFDSVIERVTADPNVLRQDASFASDLSALVAEVNRYTRSVGLDLASEGEIRSQLDQAVQRLVALADGGHL
jgi:DNA repair exonuclease SbcCD nuclease subunit